MTTPQRVQEIQQSTARPIPGQSLTNDPESPMVFEKPPRFTDVHEATEYLWVKMIEEETYIKLMTALKNETPLIDIAKLLVMGGAQEGLWNPDLCLLLLEPTVYMLLALAERLNIEIVMSAKELDKKLNKENTLGVDLEESKAREILQAAKTGIIPEGVITPAMEEQLEEADLPDDEESLLAPPKSEGVDEGIPPEATQQQESLLAPPQN